MACAVDESTRKFAVAPRDVEDAVPYNARPAALAGSPLSACPVPFYPVRYKSDTKIGPAHLGEPVRFLWQYRIIQQEHSARDFLPIQGLKSAGILCVFQTFRTAESAKNIRRRTKRNYAVLPYITALLHRRLWTRSGRPWAVPSAPAPWAFPSGFPSAPSAPPWGAPSPRRAWRPDGCASRSSSG